MPHCGRAVHRAILIVDIERFCDESRTNAHLIVLRAALYSLLSTVLAEIGTSLTGCYHEDRGDGVFVLVPPEVPKSLLVDVVPGALARELDRHNRGRPPEEQMRLRLALHAGEINHDRHGVSGCCLNRAFRLLAAPPLKKALLASPGTLAVIVSTWFYDEVVRHRRQANPAAYRQVRVTNEDTATTAWICLPQLEINGAPARAASAP